MLSCGSLACFSEELKRQCRDPLNPEIRAASCNSRKGFAAQSLLFIFTFLRQQSLTPVGFWPGGVNTFICFGCHASSTRTLASFFSSPDGFVKSCFGSSHGRSHTPLGAISPAGSRSHRGENPPLTSDTCAPRPMTRAECFTHTNNRKTEGDL